MRQHSMTAQAFGASTGQRRPRVFRRTAIAIGIWPVVIGAGAFGQTFTPLGFLPSPSLNPESIANAISGDGSTVVGRTNEDVIPPFGRAVRWINGGAPQPLSSNFGEESQAHAVNRDGTVVVGWSNFVPTSGFLWTAADGVQPLDLAPGAYGAFPWGVSDDGSVVVGTLFYPQGQRAGRWNGIHNPIDLGALPGGTYSTAYDVSADGSVIVGYSDAGDAPLAFRYTAAEGMVSLGRLSEDGASNARAVSGDGSVIVGSTSVTGEVGVRMFRWTEADGMRNLGVISPGSDSDAQDVNADGSVIVGRSYMFESQQTRALLWTAGVGLVDLNTYLPLLGIDLSGWLLVDAVGVSDDGRTITGLGVHDGFSQAWVATLPACAADFNHDFALNSQDFFDYLSAYFTADPRADFDHDGTIDSADFFQYVTEFLAGCGG